MLGSTLDDIEENGATSEYPVAFPKKSVRSMAALSGGSDMAYIERNSAISSNKIPSSASAKKPRHALFKAFYKKKK